MSFTLVALHAHPDDEALLTGGTIARAVAEGHRVVLVVATAGEAGLSATGLSATGTTASAPGELGELRWAELERSAAVLGVHRIVGLGYGDSGMDGQYQDEQCRGARPAFSAVPVHEPAARLAAILREESATALISYDPRGGYGHPDHVQVHRVGRAAADLAGTPLLLEATLDRRLLRRTMRAIEWLPRLPEGFSSQALAGSFAAPEELTHRVDVRRYLPQKRAAMAAHATQATADSGTRLLAVLLRLPGPLFAATVGREWFVERGRTPSRPLLDDIFRTVR
ncbi:MAG TPA: PIG-L family deacetylase [Jatrophihabitantaceae bacterium]|nr:PIG-L family deacetylase [Jatrophihabitantaceae bacterium]